MKKKTAYALTVLLLAMLPLFCAACARKKDPGRNLENQKQQEGEASSQAGQETAKGRYREEAVSLPVVLETIFDVSREGETVRLLGENEPGSFCCCESKDSGANWQKTDFPMDWLPERYRVVSACFAPAGDVIVSAGKMSEDVTDMQHAVGAYVYFRISGTGDEFRAESLSLALPEPEGDYSDTGYGLSELCASKEGKIFGLLKVKQPGERLDGEGTMMSSQAYCFSPEGGEALWRREVRAGTIALSGGRVYLGGFDGGVRALDAESGKELEDIEIPLEVRLDQADFKDGQDRIFYCDKTGIYGTDFGLGFRELLVDGKRSQFGSEIDYAVQELYCVSEHVFLVFVENTALKKELFRYEYDGSLDTEPEQELYVYSLKSNDTAKKLISDFQSNHPQVSVNYQVGMEEGTGKTESDAINLLNTEIMAGKGPDVLILNNLPWESYAEQGILEEFTEELAQEMEQGEFFENLFLPFQKEGKQYAAPVSFQIPMLVGDGKVPKAESLEELSEAIQDTEGTPPLYRPAKSLLRYLASIYWQRIEQEGVISKEELKRLLEETEKINRAIQEKGEKTMLEFISDEAENPSADVFAGDIGMSSIQDIKYGNTAMALGYLGYFPDFVDMHNMELAGHAISGPVFRSLLAGINSRSERLDTAKEFLKFALSEEEQGIFAGKNFLIQEFPVNRKAYAKMIQKPSSEEIEELYGNRYEMLERMFQVSFTWPDKEEFDRLEETIEALSVPAMEDSVVIRTVTEHGMKYLSGEKELDGAVNEMARVLELYFAEKGKQ